MDDEAKAITKAISAGGDMSKEKIAQFNEDIENICTYCLDGPANDVHTRWTCKAFKEDRIKIDAEIAAIPPDLLPYCIQCVVAPAMALDGNSSFWGHQLPDELDDKIKKLLGRNTYLKTPARDGQAQLLKDQALGIAEDDEWSGLNARQFMMKQKEAYGTGSNLDFPKATDIEMLHQGLDQSQGTRLNDDNDKVTDGEDTITLNQFQPDGQGFYDVFGDGSYTTPRNWIAALGGFGLWIPRWPGTLKQTFQFGAIKGLKASSTRMELAGWITSLTLPFKNNYATDNAAVVGKATKMLAAAKKRGRPCSRKRNHPDIF